jgi:hypothetical protein
MPHLLPPIELEPPPDYVAFVARHLAPLRDDATRVVGDPRYADELYPEVLTDVAARWSWLELVGRRLHRRGAAEEYLHRSFARRSQQWRPEEQEQDGAVEVQVWQSDPGPMDRWDLPPQRTARSSVALRLAPVMESTARTEFTPVLEAAVAWLHACEVRRRRRLIAALSIVTMLFLVLVRTLQASAAAMG